MDKGRIIYFVWAARRRFGADRSCPACGSQKTALLKRKMGVTALLECDRCKLRFRVPKDDSEITTAFYTEESYTQGFTTDLPSDAELAALLESKFQGTEKDFAYRLRAMKYVGLRPGGKLLDFGSSWGYGSWQLRDGGYEVSSYEIGRERARFAEQKLGCVMVENLRVLDGEMDGFFSADVIEHLPNPNLLFDEATRVLKPGGLLICYCPNGAPERERAKAKEYHQSWGMVHPVCITPEYLRGQAEKTGFQVEMIRSDSWDWGNADEDPRGYEDRLEGDELLFVARKR